MINKLRYKFEVNTERISELQNKEILTIVNRFYCTLPFLQEYLKMCLCEWHGTNVLRNL